jgi:hypothetical protein
MPFASLIVTVFVGIVSYILFRFHVYGFVLAFWYFVACEYSGVHKRLKLSLRMAYLVYTYKFDYSKDCYNVKFCHNRIRTALKLYWLLAIVLQFLYQRNTSPFIYWVRFATGTGLRILALVLWLQVISFATLYIPRAIVDCPANHTADDVGHTPDDVDHTPDDVDHTPDDVGHTPDDTIILVFYIMIAFFSSQNYLPSVIVYTLIFNFSYDLKMVQKLYHKKLKQSVALAEFSYWNQTKAILRTLAQVCIICCTIWMFSWISTFFPANLILQMILIHNLVTAMQALCNLAEYLLNDHDKIYNFERLDDWIYYIGSLSMVLNLLVNFTSISILYNEFLRFFQGNWTIYTGK